MTVLAGLPTLALLLTARVSVGLLLEILVLGLPVLRVLAVGFVLGLIVRWVTRKKGRRGEPGALAVGLIWTALPVSILGLLPLRVVVGDLVISWVLLAGGLVALGWVILSACDDAIAAHAARVEAGWIAALLTVWSITASAFTNESMTWVEPASPSGCRLLAAERSFVWAGGGEVFVVPPMSPIAISEGAYVADDGVHLVKQGEYRIQWRDDQTAELTYTGINAMEERPLIVTCPQPAFVRPR